MKRYSVALFLICLTIFLSLRLYSISKKEQIYKFTQIKPEIPKPLRVKKDPYTLLPLSKESKEAEMYFSSIVSHPWVKAQPRVLEISIEMVKDISLCQKVCEQIQMENPNFTEEDLIELISSIQKKVPFEFPEEIYQILCLPEESKEYQIYERLYLGENDLGLPFYLDVRVWEEKEAEKFLGKWIENEDPFLEKPRFIRLKKTSFHGFEGIEMEQGLFLYPVLQGSLVYVAFAEGPWQSFEKYIPLLQKIKLRICEHILK